MKRRLLFFLAFLVAISAQSQDVTGRYLYRGTLNNNLDVTFYFRKVANACNGQDDYYGMYKYDNQSQWILLEVSTDGKGKFCMVERPYTGTLIVSLLNKMFTGYWYSPDGNKQLSVLLSKYTLSAENEAIYDGLLDKIMSENNDC